MLCCLWWGEETELSGENTGGWVREKEGGEGEVNHTEQVPCPTVCDRPWNAVAVRDSRGRISGDMDFFRCVHHLVRQCP